ncbi:MAG TPA: potassium channel family protein [Thermoanaerobaculia bacterium]|nr:potassium channel family protein [Thermoanaerobaculia bacterium]
MHSFAVVFGILLIGSVLWDAFETIVLPHRVSRKFRLTRFFYVVTWPPFRAAARRREAGNPRDNFLSIYGPLSLIVLLIAWAVALILGFAFVDWGLGTKLDMPAGIDGFKADLYFSATTFVTLGLGDIRPDSHIGRLLTSIESGMGFGFLALVVGYLPTLFQAFARREVNVSLLDARAGSPPTAAEFIRRHGGENQGRALAELLHEWETWSADLLETTISFPVLAYYRSQHDNQSWLAGLTAVLDVCALVIAGVEEGPTRSARLTFAMARHALVDVSQVFRLKPALPDAERLPREDMVRLKEMMTAAGLSLKDTPETESRLSNLRGMYEPYAHALGQYLLMPLPRWVPPVGARDNWQTTE